MNLILSVRSILVIALLLLMAGCAGTTQKGEEEKALQKISCISVVPAVPLSEAEGALARQQKTELEQGTVLIDRVIGDELAGVADVRILNSTQMEGLLSDAGGGRLAWIKSIARGSGCDAVLYVTVKRYRERVGGELAAGQPASASFDMTLVHGESGVRLWSTSFDETQEALFSNLLSMKKASSRGFKWISVEQMVSEAVRARLAECPYLKR
ncbi:MAG: hypothetical protein ABFS19_04805 [Thermodesulfobacteriota bacterium]